MTTLGCCCILFKLGSRRNLSREAITGNEHKSLIFLIAVNFGGDKLTLAKEKKQKIITDYKEHPKDTGSAAVQVALLSERINQLGDHFKAHKKDHHSRRGLLSMVGNRRRLLSYLKKEDNKKYQEVLDKLSLRK